MDERRIVKFRRMADGTEADYKLLEELEHEFHRELPARIMKELRDLEHSYSGYQVTRLEHSLISATLAEREKADIDWIATALIHDIGDALSPANHSQLAAAIGAPYLREECTWVMKTHGVFQMVYYAHFTGGDRYARNMYKDHPYYQTGVDFCERWDQSAFDPDYAYEPLEHFAPLVKEVFSRAPWDAKVLRKGEKVPLVDLQRGVTVPPALEHEHTPQAIRARLHDGRRPNYLRDFVYGGIDGAVTTFAVVSGVSGAELSPAIVIILGIANLLADGFSMAASNYSGTKTEIDDAERLRAVEERHIRLVPDGEREEVRQIMAGKGLSGDTLEDAVRMITADKRIWIETMLSGEYGLASSQRAPFTSALATFAAFVVCGSVPLMPFLLGGAEPFHWSLAATTAVFFAIGSIKSRWSLAPWWRSGLELSAIGLAAAGVAYLVGYLLGGLA